MLLSKSHATMNKSLYVQSHHNVAPKMGAKIECLGSQIITILTFGRLGREIGVPKGASEIGRPDGKMTDPTLPKGGGQL